MGIELTRSRSHALSTEPIRHLSSDNLSKLSLFPFHLRFLLCVCYYVGWCPIVLWGSVNFSFSYSGFLISIDLFLSLIFKSFHIVDFSLDDTVFSGCETWNSCFWEFIEILLCPNRSSNLWQFLVCLKIMHILSLPHSRFCVYILIFSLYSFYLYTVLGAFKLLMYERSI